MWHGNIAREYTLLRETHKAKQEIITTGNLLEHEGGNRTDYEVATLERFASEYDEAIHTAAGEGRARLSLDRREDGTIDTEGSKVKTRIVELIKGYARGEFTDEAAFREAEKRMMVELAQDPEASKYLGEGQLYAANLFEIAQTIKAKGIADDKLDEVLTGAEIILGEGRLGSRTETERTSADRVAEKLSRTPFLNEAVVATAVGAVYSAVGWSVKRSFSRVAGAALLPGVAGGLVAGTREWNAMRAERLLLGREMAKGKYDRLTGRRAELVESLYETKSAKDLIDQVGLLYDEHGNFRDTDPKGALEIIADAQARIRLSDRDKIDLISYSGPGKVEQERFDLDLALAKAKVDLRHFMEGATDEQLAAIGVATTDIPALRAGDALNFLLEPIIDGQQGVLDTNIVGEIDADKTAKDKIYRKIRNNHVIGAVIKGTVIGMAIGTAMQEGVATVEGAQAGILEGSNAHGGKETILHTIFEHNEGKSHQIRLQAEEQQINGGETKITMPQGFSMEAQDNTATVTGPNGIRVEGLAFTSGGNLTTASLDSLKSHGVLLGEVQGEQINLPPLVTEVNHSPQEWLNNHKDMTTRVNRVGWYANDTEAPVFDQNELRFDKPVLDANGNIVMNINRMTENGSYEHGLSANWKTEAAAGHLSIGLSLSEGTQHEVVQVPIDTNGHAIISPNSPIAALFEKQGSNNEMVFTGKYAEVMQQVGVDSNGAQQVRMLATAVGPGKQIFHDTISQPRIATVHHYTLQYTETAASPDQVLVMPTAPLYTRAGSESPDRRRTPTETTEPKSITSSNNAYPINSGGARNALPPAPTTPLPNRPAISSRTAEEERLTADISAAAAAAGAITTGRTDSHNTSRGPKDDHREQETRRLREAAAAAKKAKAQRTASKTNSEDGNSRTGNIPNADATPAFYRDVLAGYSNETRAFPMPEGTIANWARVGTPLARGRGIANMVMWRLIDADPSLNPNLYPVDSDERASARKKLKRRANKLLHIDALAGANLSDATRAIISEGAAYLTNIRV